MKAMLRNSGETEEDTCSFCAGTFIITDVLYQDEQIVVIRDYKPAGMDHWLIMPRHHIRDVECLSPADLPLLTKMMSIRDTLLRQRHPSIPRTSSRIHTGFHRGRRKVQFSLPFGIGREVSLPDIISVRHLHMHVIVDPYKARKFVKYNSWNLVFWIGIDEVMKRLRLIEKGRLIKGKMKAEVVEDTKDKVDREL